MKIGIAGLSGSGKTTIFSSFLGLDSSLGAARQSSGVVNVPDERIDKLSALFKPQKTVYTTVVFEDMLPLDTPTKQDKIKMYDRMKIMDAFVFVVGAYRAVTDEDVVKEASKLRFELIVNDLDFVTKRVERIEREVRLAVKDKAVKEKELELLLKLQPVLEQEKFLTELDFDAAENEIMANYNLLTVKPACYVVNVSENTDKENADKMAQAVEKMLRSSNDNSPVLWLNAVLESELAVMEPDERAEFMGEYGISEMGKDRVIKAAYDLLDLITFFTVGEDECRGWTVTKGSNAVDAAGAIHSDLARGFIRAEVIPWDTLLELGSLANAKKAGKLRLEGKTYIVKDGDILHVMFNI